MPKPPRQMHFVVYESLPAAQSMRHNKLSVCCAACFSWDDDERELPPASNFVQDSRVSFVD